MPDTTAPDVTDLLPREAVRLGLAPTDRDDAVRQVGQVLVDTGRVDPAYIDAMHEREAMISSALGEGFAIPHGTDEGRVHIHRAGLAFLQFPDGITWEDEQVFVAIGIAAASDEHLTVMATLAKVLVDPGAAERLRTTSDPDEVLALLAPAPD